MNIKNIIIASAVAVLSVTGIQEANAQHVTRRHHVTVRHGHHPRHVVRHRTHRAHRRAVVVRTPNRRYRHGVRAHRTHRSHRRHGATVIVR